MTTHPTPATTERTHVAGCVFSDPVAPHHSCGCNAPATPEETEREARELADARNGLLEAMASTPRNSDAAGVIGKSVDRLEAAVAAVEYERGRRAERERLAGIVKGMRLPHDGNCSSLWSAEPNHPFCDCPTQPHNAALDALLAKLREAKR